MMDHRVQHVVSYIRDNFQRRLTLKEMADTVHLSPWWLCHLFRVHMDTSPDHFLAQVRLEEAKHLLETEFLSVKEVMNRVGIADATNFSRSFKVAYGLTPAKYRSEFESHVVKQKK